MKKPQSPESKINNIGDVVKLVSGEEPDANMIEALELVYLFYGGRLRIESPIARLDFLAKQWKNKQIFHELNREYCRLCFNPKLPSSLVKNKAKPKKQEKTAEAA